jgi:hypothetical protein
LGNIIFLFFDEGVRALLLSGIVGSNGPPCSVVLLPAWKNQA